MAKHKAGEKPEVLYRAVKFEIRPKEQELAEIMRVSENLRSVYNEALRERVIAFNTHIAPLYEELKSASDASKKEVRAKLSKAYKDYGITLFDQINSLTPKRAESEEYSSVPRNWQEETLDDLNGAFSSFLALRKNGDWDAEPPRERSLGYFRKIPGRYGFKVADERFILTPLGISFPMPEYQAHKLKEALRLKKFELYRDVKDLSKPGRFWISVVYEISAPAVGECSREDIVFVSLGSSYVGVISRKGEEAIPLWRPDEHWIPLIESVGKRMKKRMKGSRGWRKLYEAKRVMQQKMARQQTQNQREIVSLDLILRHGKHFVLTDYVVRSKPRKLADSSKVERRGSLGLNWQAQNTGSFARIRAQLEEKVRECGGSAVALTIPYEGDIPGACARDALEEARRLKLAYLELLDKKLVG